MIVNNLSYQINGKTIIDNISFVLSNKNKVGLVGENGSGKTTLLKILSSYLKDYTGNVNNESETIAYLKQEIEKKYNDLTVFEYVKQEIGLKKLEEKLKILENNLSEKNMDEYGEVLNEFLLLDGYSIENNLKEILNGLNFKKNLSTKISTLSGEEKIKILLSVVLLKNADILLLDEPTNNLDLESIIWLEQKLKNSNKKMIIISHDETFLNNIVNKIFELSKGNLKEYNLKYEEYLKEKNIEYEKEKSKYEELQEKRKNLKKQLQKAKEWVNGINNKKAHNDNDKLAFNFLSFNKLFKSFSCYLILNDKKLIRISNHWSNSNLNNINKCGWIRSCFWELKGNKAKNKDTKQLQMGIVDFAKMNGVSNETML